MSARDDIAAHFTSGALADGLLDAHRAEAVTEGINALRKWDPSGRSTLAPGLTFAIGVLMSVRDDRTGEEATAPAATATPDFFQPGHTYVEPGDTTDWKFRCDSITTHPDDGERTAIGWRHFHGEWEPYAYGEDDWEIHQIADHINTTTGDTHA